ncbi:MAG: bifunctional diguanylate cyclase/phosphodiesterase [Gammaproteobacteria bacterium]|nr:bifunctional diguanylate cyclase/phosphodiesterase [Gammaproteobacteria bacterium]
MSQVQRDGDQDRRFQELELALRLREREIELLKETVFAINSQLDLDTVFHLVADRARELICAETLLIPVVDTDCQHYTYRAGAGRNAAEIVGESLPLDYGVCGWVWRHKRPWWRGVLDELEPADRTRWEIEAGTLILVPMIGKNHFLGGLAGINKQGGGDFSQQDLSLLSLFAGQVSIAIENAIAFEELSKAKHTSEAYQIELHQLNNELTAINRELEHLALYDQLTQLPNRSLLQDRLQQALFSAQREEGRVAVLIVDLDQFKEVNDTLGHDVGDQLLVQVAERFSGQLRQTDTVGRLGGDEFAVVIPNADTELACHLAGNLLAVLEPDFDIDGMRFSVAASVGIAVHPQHGVDAGTLMKHADIAMYTAKRTRFGYTVYDPSEAVAQPERLSLVGDLRQALVNREFDLYFQPKVDLRSGTLSGVEALARWPHAKRGLVPPDQFIPMLEQTGLIRPFTLWAIERGLQQCAQWQESGMHLTMAINLSIHNLLDPQFITQVVPLLQRFPISRSCLILEITESVFLSEHAKLSNVLNELRSHGVAFSIDDFGTGHSSLSRLKKLPVSELKIDRSFVMDMETDRDDAVIVRSTVDLAHNLGIAVIAEGVENESTLNMLREMGCDLAQGYFISRPLPADDFARYLQNTEWKIPRST